MSNTCPPVSRLIGRENYSTWCVAVRASLLLDDLWSVIEDGPPLRKIEDGKGAEIENPNYATELSTFKASDRKALAKITLLVDPVNYPHIEKATSARQAWENLKNSFQDDGLSRRIGLIRQLTHTYLNNCKSVDEYVNTIISTAQRLREVDFEVPDKWIGAMLLAGLPEDYQPMIMALENCGQDISADFVKVKILQEVKATSHSNEESAFYSNKKNKKGIKCTFCGKFGHHKNSCWDKKGETNAKQPASFNSGDKKFGSSKSSKNKKAFAAFLTQQKYSDDDWFLDSCASMHLTNNASLLQDPLSEPGVNITTINDETLQVKSVGTANISVIVDGIKDKIRTENVNFVPNIAANLLSVAKITDKGNTIVFDKLVGKIFDSEGELIATASRSNGIYKIDRELPSSQPIYLSKANGLLMHRRLGHLNRIRMRQIQTMADGVGDVNLDLTCEVCALGKHARAPFRASKHRYEKPLQLVFTDLAGPMEVTSIGGSRYFFTVIDAFSRYTFVYFIEKKSEVFDIFKQFKVQAERQTGNLVKIVRSDNGTEYVNKSFKKYFAAEGIRHQRSAHYSPQQNGVAERAMRSIVEKARCMLADADLPTEYWAEAVSTAVYLNNRSPTKAVKGMTPYEAWFGEKPDLSHLRIFGCPAMVHIPSQKRRKWDHKSTKMLFMGYCAETKAYRFFNPSTRKIVISRDVIFLEDALKYSASSEAIEKTSEKSSSSTTSVVSLQNLQNPSKNLENLNQLHSQNTVTTPETQEDNSDTSTLPPLPEGSDSDIESIEGEDETIISQEPIVDQLPSDERPRRSGRAPKPLRDLDFEYSFLAEKLNEENGEHALNYEIRDDPITYAEATLGPEAEFWNEAMDEEFKSLIKNETFEVVDPPTHKKPLSMRWVFRIKNDGNKKRYKARLVVRGCAQIPGQDYHETFSPVVRHSSLRYMMSLAASKDWDVDHMDVKTAYLYGELDEDIYVTPPSNLTTPENKGKVWKLKKAIYGLKQAGRCWNKKITSVLEQQKLKRSQADPCVFYSTSEKKILIVTLWVDDVIIFSNNEKLKKQIKFNLEKHFDMKDLGPVKKCLGMNISRNRASGELFIDQKDYIQQVLKRFGMEECHPVGTPMEVDTKPLIVEEKSPFNTNVPYQEAVGCLLYISQISRPDINHAVNTVSRFTKNYQAQHWKAIKRIFRYLKGTEDYRLCYSKKMKSDVLAYSDSDWGNLLTQRYSVSGSTIKFNGGLIAWSSRRQRTIALSTVEAEYMSLSSCVQEVLWLRALINEIDPAMVHNHPTEIFCDNLGAIQLSNNDIVSNKSKHIDLRYHFLKEHIKSNEIKLTHIRTDDMIADAMTKPLAKPKFDKFVREFGVLKV